MRINVFIDEIEFEQEEGLEFNFYDQVRIKKAFETELSKLLLDTKNDGNQDFSVYKILNNINNNKFFFTAKYSGNLNFIKEIDGGEFSLLSEHNNPYQVGKRLAKSIYSSLNLIDSGKRSTNITTANGE